MAGKTQAQSASVREGARWLHAAPAAEDVGKWFLDNAKVHDGLDPQDYIDGLTIIPAIENVKTLGPDGQELWTKRQTYTPYIRVDTRVRYFWDWAAKHPDWLCEIESVAVRRLSGAGYFNEHLPPGFFLQPVQHGTNWVHFLGCSMQVRVYERDLRTGGKGRLVMAPPPGTKTVPLIGRYGPDENAVMKAETGAVGRALGMAGMLVLPGSSVATAEDMQGQASDSGQVATGPAPELPGDTPATAKAPQPQEPPAPDELRATYDALIERLKAHPEQYAVTQEWAGERSIDLDAPEDNHLRGLVRQLERKLRDLEKS